MSGWIKLHRKMKEWEWISDPNVLVLWVHLLLNANYKAKKFMGHDVEIGSLATGLNSLSEKTGLSVQQLRTALKKLEESEQIIVRTTNKFSIISIVNWELYQNVEEEVTNKTSEITKPCVPEIKKTEKSTSKITNKNSPKGIDNHHLQNGIYYGATSKITNEQQTDNKRITTSERMKERKKERNLQRGEYGKTETNGNHHPENNHSDFNLNGFDFKFSGAGFEGQVIQLDPQAFKELYRRYSHDGNEDNFRKLLQHRDDWYATQPYKTYQNWLTQTIKWLVKNNQRSAN